jgi:anti-anti-sigma factor
VITVRGEVDLNTCPLLSDRLHRVIHRSGPDLIVDLTGVQFFGAAGVAVLVDVRSAAVTAEVGFRVVANTRAVLLPLSITGTDCLFDVFPDLLQAMMPSRVG